MIENYLGMGKYTGVSTFPSTPCAFLSKGLNDVERNYDVHDKEMLGIIRALEAWRQDRKSTRLNSSHDVISRMPSSA